MIVPVWNNKEMPQGNMEVQESVIPRTRYIRVLVESPTLDDLDKIRQVLIDSGVPLDAELGFSQWKTPDTNWYIYAQWSE